MYAVNTHKPEYPYKNWYQSTAGHALYHLSSWLIINLSRHNKPYYAVRQVTIYTHSIYTLILLSSGRLYSMQSRMQTRC